jgi:hypothetical protein
LANDPLPEGGDMDVLANAMLTLESLEQRMMDASKDVSYFQCAVAQFGIVVTVS